MHNCAPKKYDQINNTCFSVDQLIEMSAAYNRFITKKKLMPENNNINFDLIDIKPHKKYLLLQLRQKFDKICGKDEICITHQSFMNDIVKEMKIDILNNTFRFDGPTNSTEWLSNVDINNIMKQYETIYTNFRFIGAVPLNCNELSFCDLHNLNFGNYILNGITQLGIIHNLDKFGEPGSHWVSTYIHILDGEIYYCDSTGNPPIKNIKNMIDSFIQYHNVVHKKQPIYLYNKNSYQKDSSECGVYSCNFLIRKLSGENFKSIVDNYLTFKDINSCRNIYFKKKSSKYYPHDKCDP